MQFVSFDVPRVTPSCATGWASPAPTGLRLEPTIKAENEVNQETRVKAENHSSLNKPNQFMLRAKHYKTLTVPLQ